MRIQIELSEALLARLRDRAAHDHRDLRREIEWLLMHFIECQHGADAGEGVG